MAKKHETQKEFLSTKTYTHNVGLSACFRQHRAASHCRFLHGYALQVELVFKAPALDHNNWVMDFGALKPIKAWLEETFDHKTLVAKDDPQISIFRELNLAGLIQMVEVEHVGCEAFAEMVFDYVEKWLTEYFRNKDHYVTLVSAQIREHAGNSAICRARV